QDLQELLHRAVLAALAVQGDEGRVGPLGAQAPDQVLVDVDGQHLVPQAPEGGLGVRPRPQAHLALEGPPALEDGDPHRLMPPPSRRCSSSFSATAAPRRRTPSLTVAGGRPEKFRRIESPPRSSRKQPRPGTNATWYFSVAVARRSVVSSPDGSVAHTNRPPCGRVHRASAGSSSSRARSIASRRSR